MLVPYMALIHYFDPVEKDKGKVAIWISNGGIGDTVGILLIVVLMKMISWKMAYEICMAIFILLAFAMYFSIHEITVE